MFSGHYNAWTVSRMNTIKKYFAPEYFKSKTLLELGCGVGHNGNKFYELGADVTSCDGRKDYLTIVNKLYPHIKTLIMDCDKDNIQDKYDVILHWGLLYHLNEIELHLENVAQKCDVLLLESVVVDSDDDILIVSHESGYDQACNNNKGCRPSQSHVERLLKKNGFNFKLIKDDMLDAEIHLYNWECKNTNAWEVSRGNMTYSLRRFWICWKNVNCPINNK